MTYDSNHRDSEPHRHRKGDQEYVSGDGAAGDSRSPLEPRDAAARRLGFRSYAALLKASTPITARDGRVHLIVEGHDGR